MQRTVILTLALALALVPAAFIAQPRVALANNAGTHIVKPGETLDGIAAMYGVSAQAIAAANKLVNPDLIYAGQTLVIPGGWVPAPPPPACPPGCAPPPPPAGPPPPGCGHHYVVQPGDSLTVIAVRNGTSIQAIASANGIPYPYNNIYAGQSLYIPCGYIPPKHHPGHKPAPKPVHKPTAHPTAKPDHGRPANCARESQIVEPKVGQHVSGTLMIVGTASIPNFQFYKVEYAMGANPLDSHFHSIGDVHRTAVVDGVLTTWYLGNMPAGTYTLRLTVVDERGQFVRPCNVVIHIN
jgi:LysM repeat protein